MSEEKLMNQVLISLLLRRACEIYKAASYQGHSSHWDSTMQGGAGCPECIRVRELREDADRLVEQANNQQGDR